MNWLNLSALVLLSFGLGACSPEHSPTNNRLHQY